MKLSISLLVLLTVLSTIFCLNLDHLGIAEDYYTSSIVVFRNRAFLTLPRTSCHNNVSDPTLIETRWNGEQLLPSRRTHYPSEKYQNWGKCEQLQNAVSVDVEAKKGRLWVLDQGNKKCAPKIVIYNLFTNNEVYTNTFEEIGDGDLTYLVVDGLRAYIGSRTGNRMLVVSFLERKWWKIELDSVSSERLVMSKIDPILYLTMDGDSKLFTANLTEIRKSKGPINISTTFVGNKLGPSGGMVADIGGGLNYYLTRDYTILRWIIGNPLKAEYHDVLLQSYDVFPYVPHLFTDAQNNVWALTNPLRPQECNIPTESPHLFSRVIKLSKFRKMGPIINRFRRKY